MKPCQLVHSCKILTNITDLITSVVSASDLARYRYTPEIYSGCVRYECLSLHSPRSRTLPEKLIVPPMLYKFPTLYGTWSLITALTRPTTCLYPEPDQSSPRHFILFIEGPFYYYPPTYTYVFQLISFLLHTKTLYATLLCAKCLGHS